MPHRCGSTLMLMVLFAAIAPGEGQNSGTQPDPAAPLTRADSRLETAVDGLFQTVSARTPGCAVGVARSGQLILAKGYGSANLEHAIPITPQTRFRIASLSKHFTAMAILLLEEQGLLSLDDDIRKYLPEWPDYGQVVTVDDLIFHSSGMPDNGDIPLKWEDAPDYFLAWAEADDFFEEGLIYEFVPQRRYLEMLRSVLALKHQPGTTYSYNNAGYVLLSVIVERASGKRLRAFADEHLFGPLGMDRTFFNDRALEVVSGSAGGYHLTPDGTYLKYETDLNTVGDGGLFTTVEDFFRWDQNFYRNRLGKTDQSLIDRLVTPNRELEYPDWILERNAASAMGLLVADTEFGPLEWSNGGWVAFTASARRLRSRQLSVFVFCNSRENIAPRLASRILELYASDQESEPTEGDR